MSDFYHGQEVKASRKRHRCDECSGDILIGESYFRHAGVWEGDFFRSKNCQDCEFLRYEYNADLEWEDRAPLGELSGHLSEEGGKLWFDLIKIKIKRSAKLFESEKQFLKEWEGESA